MHDSYGEVEGERREDTAEAVKTDTFECLLGLCRVLGLRYEVKAYGDRWSAKLTTTDRWPGDFFDCGKPRGHNGSERSFSYAGAPTRRDAVFSAITMAYAELHRSAQHWRYIVRDQPQYSNWFR